MLWIIVFWRNLWLLGNTSLTNGSKPASRIRTYFVDVIMPVNSTTGVAPHGDIPPHTCTFAGCLALDLSFRGSPIFNSTSGCRDQASLKTHPSRLHHQNSLYLLASSCTSPIAFPCCSHVSTGSILVCLIPNQAPF